jgi:hypothetical protein
LKRKASNSFNKYANVCFFLPRIKRILGQSTSQGDERGLPRIGSKPAIRLNASLVTEQKKKAKDQVTYNGGVPATVSAFVQTSLFTFRKLTRDIHALVSTGYTYSRCDIVHDEWSRIDIDIRSSYVAASRG